jgi:cysteinyl-tRNA synthetase
MTRLTRVWNVRSVVQIFPHHENELAQSRACCCGEHTAASSDGAASGRLARFWLHNGFVNIDNEKMCACAFGIHTAKPCQSRSTKGICALQCQYARAMTVLLPL